MTSNNGKRLTPYVVKVQQNVDIFGGELVEVEKYSGLYTLTNTALDGEDIMCIFPAKPSNEIDKVGAVVMGTHKALKPKEAGKPISVSLSLLLDDLRWEQTQHNKNKLIQDLDCFYQMNIVGRTPTSTYQMRFLSMLEVDEGLENVKYRVSDSFEYKMANNKVRNMETVVIVDTNSKYARTLYRLLHAQGEGGGRLKKIIAIHTVERYLGIEDLASRKRSDILGRAFKEVARLTGVSYKRLKGRKVYERIDVKKVVQTKPKSTPIAFEDESESVNTPPPKQKHGVNRFSNVETATAVPKEEPVKEIQEVVKSPEEGLVQYLNTVGVIEYITAEEKVQRLEYIRLASIEDNY